jgi:hypothetical protein
MNAEQVKSAVRWLVSFVGGFIVAKGWVKADQLTALLSNEAVMGALAGGAVLVWGMFTHTQSNAVAVVATIAEDPTSPVKGVVTTNTAEGRALARDTPSDTVVAAGTPEATAIAKPGA